MGTEGVSKKLAGVYQTTCHQSQDTVIFMEKEFILLYSKLWNHESSRWLSMFQRNILPPCTAQKWPRWERSQVVLAVRTVA